MLSSVESDEQQQPKRVRGQSCRYQSLTENYDSRGCEGLSPKDKLLYKINIITIVSMTTIVIIFLFLFLLLLLSFLLLSLFTSLGFLVGRDSGFWISYRRRSRPEFPRAPGLSGASSKPGACSWIDLV